MSFDEKILLSQLIYQVILLEMMLQNCSCTRFNYEMLLKNKISSASLIGPIDSAD